MKFKNQTPIEFSGCTGEGPDELFLEYFVEFRYSGNNPVGTHYDTTVSVPPKTDKQTIVDWATEVVTSHVPSVRAAELEVALTSIEAASLDAAHQEAVPAQRSRIEFPERIRYSHDGRVCEGKIVDVILDSSDSLMEAAVVATHAEGTESVDNECHRVPLSAITARLESSD